MFCFCNYLVEIRYTEYYVTRLLTAHFIIYLEPRVYTTEVLNARLIKIGELHKRLVYST